MHDAAVDVQPISKGPYRLFLIPCDKQVFRLFVALPIQIKCALREIQGSPLAGGSGDLQWITSPKVKERFSRNKFPRPVLPSLGGDLTKLFVNPELLFVDEFFYRCRRQMGRRTNHNGPIVFDG